MINKNEKRRRTFKPVPISDKLKDINKKLLYKFGQLDYVIYAKWGDIVGEFFVQHSEPIKINSVLSTTNDLGERIYDKLLPECLRQVAMVPVCNCITQNVLCDGIMVEIREKGKKRGWNL